MTNLRSSKNQEIGIDINIEIKPSIDINIEIKKYVVTHDNLKCFKLPRKYHNIFFIDNLIESVTTSKLKQTLKRKDQIILASFLI